MLNGYTFKKYVWTNIFVSNLDLSRIPSIDWTVYLNKHLLVHFKTETLSTKCFQNRLLYILPIVSRLFKTVLNTIIVKSLKLIGNTDARYVPHSLRLCKIYLAWRNFIAPLHITNLPFIIHPNVFPQMWVKTIEYSTSVSWEISLEDP